MHLFYLFVPVVKIQLVSHSLSHHASRKQALGAVVYQLKLWSLSAICAPVMPGTRVKDETTMAAPWWAPADFKEEAFDFVCAGRTRTTLYWSNGYLMLKDTNSKILIEKRSTALIVKHETIDFIQRKGKIETVMAPWAV